MQISFLFTDWLNYLLQILVILKRQSQTNEVISWIGLTSKVILIRVFTSRKKLPNLNSPIFFFSTLSEKKKVNWKMIYDKKATKS